MSADKLENLSIELVDETERDAVLDVLRESFYKVELKFHWQQDETFERKKYFIKYYNLNYRNFSMSHYASAMILRIGKSWKNSVWAIFLKNVHSKWSIQKVKLLLWP